MHVIEFLIYEFLTIVYFDLILAGSNVKQQELDNRFGLNTDDSQSK